jgi:hypothetical protein
MAEFLDQKLHRALRIGAELRAVHGATRGRRVFLQQGALDSACGHYATVMALILLGHIEFAGVSRADSSRRRILKRLAMQSPEAFFQGMTDEDFEELIASTGFHVRLDRVNGSTGRCVAHTVRALSRGKLVLLGIASRSDGFVHATLAVGTEGTQRGRNVETETLLCLDPSARPWPYCGYNARLMLKVPRSGAPYLRYLTSYSPRLTVTIWSAIALW